ncbi:MAG: glycosyltransferase [Chloroflexi bacterium]|nr:glycosyltransferase [Chloroflexota bacterium]
MKIGILELLEHHIFLYSLASVARRSGADVTIFTTETLYARVAPLFKARVEDYRWVIRGRNERLWSVLKRVERIAETELDLLIVNTLEGSALYWLVHSAFAPNCKTLLVTGRITDWFENKYRLAKPWDVVGFLNNNVAHFVARRMMPRFDGIVVHTRAMQDYALAHGYTKDIVLLPYSIYEENGSPANNGKKVKFVVTGSIDDCRRNYDGLLDGFEKLSSSGREKVCLTLLGWPASRYGRRIIDRCRRLKEGGLDVRFYDEFIPEESFMAEMASADALINPVRLTNYRGGIFMSGLVEAIRHAKPGIYPAGYVVPEELLSSSLFYSGIEQLPCLIEDTILTDGGVFQELSRNAIVNAQKYSLQAVADYFKTTVLERMLR